MEKNKFGLFLKEARMKKGYTQKELADLLFLDVTTVSKWERGVSYPGITLIPEICKHLDISEHELIASSTDNEYHKIKNDAKKYNKIKKVFFLVISICYIVAVITCFIVNLSVDKCLSWFFIVFSSCLCGFSFIPTFTVFFKKYKLPVFISTTFLTLSLMYIVISIYTNNYWCYFTIIATLLFYFAFFYPFLYFRQKRYLSDNTYKTYKKFFLITYSTGLLLLTLLLLFMISLYTKIDMSLAIPITLYSSVIMFLFGLVELLNVRRSVKLSLYGFSTTAYLVGLCYVFNTLFKEDPMKYTKINFSDWNQYVDGNVAIIVIVSLLLISCAFLAFGIYKSKHTYKK